jgi:hypothetical protein
MFRRTALAVLSTAALAATVVGVAPAQAAAPAAPEAQPKTTVTLTVRGCEGCELQLQSWLEGETTGSWASRPKEVVDGTVSWKVPTWRTEGLSIGLADVPWADERLNAQPLVAMRYSGFKPGERVSYADAHSARKGTVCFAGTEEDALDLTVKVKPVKADGIGGEVRAPMGWVVETQEWLRPMNRTNHGVLATQDVPFCTGG